MVDRIKPLFWVASSKKDLMGLPEPVKDMFGFALHLAQEGKQHPQSKVLKGFKSAGVLEVVDDFDGNAYRAVYTIRFADVVYVLHCFQKKSSKGIATPKPDMDLIRARLKAAAEHVQKEQTK